MSTNTSITITAHRPVTTGETQRPNILYRRALSEGAKLSADDEVKPFLEDGVDLYRFCVIAAHTTACDAFDFPTFASTGAEVISAFRRWLDTLPNVTRAIEEAFDDALKPEGDAAHLPPHEVTPDEKNA